MKLLDAGHNETISGVTSFVGEDSSGSFGLQAGHARIMTTLVTGLARFRIGSEPWRYIALPGGILYFDGKVLTLCTRHFLLDDDYRRISEALQQQLLAEEAKLATIKESLRHLEDEILKRMWEIGRQSGS